MTSHLYPANSQWSGQALGAECTDGDHTSYDLITKFTHADGRVITVDITTTLAGEVLVNGEQRDPRWLDGFATTVDEAYEQLLAEYKPEALSRNFWLYDTTVACNAASCEDRIQVDRETREESTEQILLDLNYHGAFADLPGELVTTRLNQDGQCFIASTLQFNDMEAMHARLMRVGLENTVRASLAQIQATYDSATQTFQDARADLVAQCIAGGITTTRDLEALTGISRSTLSRMKNSRRLSGNRAAVPTPHLVISAEARIGIPATRPDLVAKYQRAFERGEQPLPPHEH